MLLMNEATVGLDPPSRQQLLGNVRGPCKSRGMGVLCATHLIEETQHAYRLMLLHQSAERFEGPTPSSWRRARSGIFRRRC